MSQPRLSRESRRAFARCFSANLKRLMEEKGMGQSALGRILDPGNKNPANPVWWLLRAKQLPAEAKLARIAEALGVPVEAFHAGEIEQFKAGSIVAAAHRKVRAKTGTVPAAEASEGLSPLSHVPASEGAAPKRRRRRRARPCPLVGVRVRPAAEAPSHYPASGVVWTCIEECGLNFNLGNVVKYVCRAGKKEELLSDLRKASDYLARELQRLS